METEQKTNQKQKLSRILLQQAPSYVPPAKIYVTDTELVLAFFH